MPPSDSDSSGGEDNDYTETNVLLGYAAREPSDDTISHIGGQPAWLDPDAPPPSSFARCKVCNNFMVLLLQLNGDLPEIFPGHERRLYVLACRKKTCRRKDGSVRAFRAIKVTEVVTKYNQRDKASRDEKTQSTKSGIDLGQALFGGRPAPSSVYKNPFAAPGTPTLSSELTSAIITEKPQDLVEGVRQTSSEVPTITDLPKTFASALSIENKTAKFGPPPPAEPWPHESALPSPYPLYYLADADYEILDKVRDEIPLPVQTIDLDEEVSSGSQREDKVVYESTIDKTFQKFADRLAQNPEQVIRYEFKGLPLLYSKYDAVGKLFSGERGNEKMQTSTTGVNRMPKCANCGSGRVFEVQLTPHTIMELERDELTIDGMEWGTIIIGVCEKDCQQNNLHGDVGYVEEFVGVQWEETRDLR